MKVYANVLGENNSGNITIKRVKRNENEINEMIKKGIEERKREEEYKKRKENNDNFKKKNMNTINGNIIDNQFNENKNKKDNDISNLTTPSKTSEGKKKIIGKIIKEKKLINVVHYFNIINNLF